MRFLFLVSLFALPIVDIASLIEVGGRIGVWPTVAAVILSAIAGGLLVRTQGVTILQQARTTLAAGAFPARQVFDGACVLVGGALLVLPGFVSDAIGLSLLLPPVRSLLAKLIDRSLQHSVRFATWTAERPVRPGGGGRGTVIEGEYETVDPERPEDRRPAGDSLPRQNVPGRDAPPGPPPSPWKQGG